MFHHPFKYPVRRKKILAVLPETPCVIPHAEAETYSGSVSVILDKDMPVKFGHVLNNSIRNNYVDYSFDYFFLPDVTLVVGGQMIQANRRMLAYFSDHFNRLFTKGFKEKTLELISLDEPFAGTILKIPDKEEKAVVPMTGSGPWLTAELLDKLICFLAETPLQMRQMFTVVFKQGSYTKEPDEELFTFSTNEMLVNIPEEAWRKAVEDNLMSCLKDVSLALGSDSAETDSISLAESGAIGVSWLSHLFRTPEELAALHIACDYFGIQVIKPFIRGCVASYPAKEMIKTVTLILSHNMYSAAGDDCALFLDAWLKSNKPLTADVFTAPFVSDVLEILPLASHRTIPDTDRTEVCQVIENVLNEHAAKGTLYNTLLTLLTEDFRKSVLYGQLKPLLSGFLYLAIDHELLSLNPVRTADLLVCHDHSDKLFERLKKEHEASVPWMFFDVILFCLGLKKQPASSTLVFTYQPNGTMGMGLRLPEEPGEFKDTSSLPDTEKKRIGLKECLPGTSTLLSLTMLYFPNMYIRNTAAVKEILDYFLTKVIALNSLKKVLANGLNSRNKRLFQRSLVILWLEGRLSQDMLIKLSGKKITLVMAAYDLLPHNPGKAFQLIEKITDPGLKQLVRQDMNLKIKAKSDSKEE